MKSLEARLWGTKYLIEISASLVDPSKQISGVKAIMFNSIIIHVNMVLVLVITSKVLSINKMMNIEIFIFIVNYLF